MSTSEAETRNEHVDFWIDQDGEHVGMLSLTAISGHPADTLLEGVKDGSLEVTER